MQKQMSPFCEDFALKLAGLVRVSWLRPGPGRTPHWSLAGHHAILQRKLSLGPGNIHIYVKIHGNVSASRCNQQILSLLFPHYLLSSAHSYYLDIHPYF